jgi:O-antigen/teichoic acid export membrane protein
LRKRALLRLTDSLPAWTRRWATDSGLLLFSQFAALVATSTLAIMLARTLGPSEWGVFSGLLGLGLAFSIFVDFGVATWLLRELSRLWASEERTPEDVRARAGHLLMGGLLLNVCLGAALVICTLVVSKLAHLEGSLTFALVCLMGYAGLLAASSALEAFFRSQRQIRRVVGAMLLEKTLLLLLVALSVIAGLGVPGIALMYVLAGLSRVIFNGFNLLGREDLVLSYAGLGQLRGTIGRSMPFALSATSTNLVPRLDAFLIASLSTTAAGYFAVGDRVVGPALIVPAVMSSALYPFLASESGRSSAGWRIVFLLMLAGTGIAIVGAACAPFIVPILFGNEYRPAVGVVQVMLFVIPFIYGNGPLQAQLYSIGREGRVLVAIIGASCVGTAAVVLGQLAFGPVGAAGGYVLRQILFFLAFSAVALVPVWVRRDAGGAVREVPVRSLAVGDRAAPCSTEGPKRSSPGF